MGWARPMNDELPVLDLWQKVIGEILDRTGRFPKAVRFTFSTRIDNLALDILDDIVAARFSARDEKIRFLRHADLGLARLMALFRLSHDRHLIGDGGYEHLSRRLVEVGSMLGGWREAARQRR